MRTNLTIVLLLGLLAFLVNAVFGGGSDSAEEEADPGRDPVSAEAAPDPGAAVRGPQIDWASWQNREPATPEADPARALIEPTPDQKRDARLEAVLKDLENVDVYVEGGKPVKTRMSSTRETTTERGFTLIEVMISVIVLATVFIIVGSVLLAGVRRTTELRERNAVIAQSWKFAERLQRIPYGSEVAGAATATQYDDLFDDDGNLGNVSLTQVRTPVGGDGLRFRLAGFEVGGVWEVQVNEDLNADGDTADINEGTGGLLRIEIYFQGESVLRTFRARPAEST